MAVVSLGVVASGTYVGGAGTLTMPFTTNIPRSDPALGATLIFMFASVAIPFGSAGIGVSFADDAASDPFYGTCYYTNGLNPYGGLSLAGAFNSGGQEGPVTVPFSQGGVTSPPGCQPRYDFGLVLNPITTSNNLVMTIGGPGTGAVNVYAVAYTGCALGGRLPADTPLFFWRTSTFVGGFYGEFFDIVDARQTTGAQWTYNANTIFSQPQTGFTVGPPFITSPYQLFSGTIVYPNWEIQGPGDLIVYTIADLNHGGFWPTNPPNSSPYGAYDLGASGAWTWGGAGPTTVYEFDDYDGNGNGMLTSMVYAEQPLGGAAPITGQDISGSWAGISNVYTVGGAFTLQSGGGPAQCGTPPPPGNYPVFENHFRVVD